MIAVYFKITMKGNSMNLICKNALITIVIKNLNIILINYFTTATNAVKAIVYFVDKQSIKMENAYSNKKKW